MIRRITMCPDGSYSTDPYKPDTRIREFKQMVQALHKAGIRVIMDMVYNHTFNTGGSNFERTVPGYFYRQKADGTWLTDLVVETRRQANVQCAVSS